MPKSIETRLAPAPRHGAAGLGGWRHPLGAMAASTRIPAPTCVPCARRPRPLPRCARIRRGPGPRADAVRQASAVRRDPV